MTKDWSPRGVTLSATKGLSERFFAEFILSVVEGLRMTRPKDRNGKCTNVLWFDLDILGNNRLASFDGLPYLDLNLRFYRAIQIDP